MPRSRAPVRLAHWRVRVLTGTWGTECTRADTETLYWCLEETQGLAAAGPPGLRASVSLLYMVG